MIPAWIKRVLNTQRNKRLNQRRYPRPPSTNYIDYGKIYGYEYVSSINHCKPNNSHAKTVKTPTSSTPPKHRYYYHDHYDDHYNDGCSSCGGMGSTCGGDSYGSGDSSCSTGGGSDGCAGGDGGCGDGGGGCGGGGCGGGCGGD